MRRTARSSPPAPWRWATERMIAGSAVSDLSLEQYAAVKAALAEPFPLEEVLSLEGVDGGDWEEADYDWTVKLTSDPALLDRYRDALGAAEDRLIRKVEPLETDVEAWVSFLSAYEAASAPDQLFTDTDLGVNDLSRLRRH